MKQILVHKIDLLELEGNGDFLCPSCGKRISPDDETEEVYSILEPKVRNNTLECLMIRCNHCSNKILLTGFSIFELENETKHHLMRVRIIVSVYQLR